jgi:hypothetical protein
MKNKLIFILNFNNIKIMQDNIYIIATTSINRSDLHNIVLYKWKKWILESGAKIKWFINIDTLEYLSESYETTKKNMETILDDSMIELFIMDPQYNKFLGACKNLAENIKKYVDNENNNLNKNTLKIIWLEDDWDLIEDLPPFLELEKYCGGMSHLNLSGIKNNFIWALAPSILTYNFFINIFYQAWKNQESDICPEKSVGYYYQSLYYHSDNTPNIILLREKIDENIIEEMIFKNTQIIYEEDNNSYENISNNDPIFIKLFPRISFDIGVEYMKNKNITKKFVKKNKRQVVIEYKTI